MMVFSFEPDGNNTATQPVEYFATPGSLLSCSQLWPCVHGRVCTHARAPLDSLLFLIKRKAAGTESLTSSLSECKESVYLAEGKGQTALPGAWLTGCTFKTKCIRQWAPRPSQPAAAHASVVTVWPPWVAAYLCEVATCRFAVHGGNSIFSCPEIGNGRKRRLC